MNKGIEKVKQAAKILLKKKDSEIHLLKTELKKANGEKIVTFKMPDTVEVRNLPDVQKATIVNFPDTQKVTLQNLKELREALSHDVQKVKIVEQETKDKEVQKVQDIDHEKAPGWMTPVASVVVKGLVSAWATLWSRGLTVKLDGEERLKPIPVIIVDSRGRPVDRQPMAGMMIPMSFPSSGNATASNAILTSILTAIQAQSTSPATSTGDGTATVTTAGTRVQLTAQAIKRVLIQAHEENTGTVVVGGSAVVAALSGRRGRALFATQAEAFEVSNMNLLYIDSTASGDKVIFYWEA